MLRVCDGLRTANHANSVVDLPSQSVTAQVNTTSVDMANFSELLVHAQCNAVTGSGTGDIVVQESNEASANFTNISGASSNFSAANTAKPIHVNWRSNGARKKYARLAAFNTTNAVTLSATTYRLSPHLETNMGNNVTAVV